MFYRVVFSVLCVASGQLFAGTLYNNLGPGNTFYSAYFYADITLLATPFTTTGAGPLSTIVLPISLGLGVPPPTFALALYSDSSGKPGSQLESWTENSYSLPNLQGQPPLTTLTSLQHPVLSAGTQYWFVITQQPDLVLWWTTPPGTSTPENDGLWGGNSLNSLMQPGSIRMNTVAFQLNSFEASPAPTPEPRSAVLLLVGLTCFCLSRRKI
jgi:hypothetical protein